MATFPRDGQKEAVGLRSDQREGVLEPAADSEEADGGQKATRLNFRRTIGKESGR